MQPKWPGKRQNLAPPVLDYTDTDLNANLKCLSIYNLISVKITPLWRLIAMSSCRPWKGDSRQPQRANWLSNYCDNFAGRQTGIPWIYFIWISAIWQVKLVIFRELSSTRMKTWRTYVLSQITWPLNCCSQIKRTKYISYLWFAVNVN